MPSHPDRVRKNYIEEDQMEYSLTNPKNGKRFTFETFYDLMKHLQHIGEVDGWILHIHHM